MSKIISKEEKRKEEETHETREKWDGKTSDQREGKRRKERNSRRDYFNEKKGEKIRKANNLVLIEWKNKRK